MHARRGEIARVFPDRDVRESAVVAARLSVVGLVLLAKVCPARFVARECVATHELGELEKVGDPSRALQGLVQLMRGARELDLVPVALAQGRDALDRFSTTSRTTRHAAMVPQDRAHFAVA